MVWSVPLKPCLETLGNSHSQVLTGMLLRAQGQICRRLFPFKHRPRLEGGEARSFGKRPFLLKGPGRAGCAFAKRSPPPPLAPASPSLATQSLALPRRRRRSPEEDASPLSGPGEGTLAPLPHKKGREDGGRGGGRGAPPILCWRSPPDPFPMEPEDARRAKQETRDSNVHRVDSYGFERPTDFDYVTYEDFFSGYLVVLTRRAIKWSKLLKGNNSVSKSLKVKRYIRKGIPNEHRPLVWMVVSGAQAHMEQNPGYYQKLLDGDKNDKLVETIKTDMNRTFPDNIRFRKSADPCLQKTLYNVLVAYGHHNQSVGYCQIIIVQK
nr:growth hormone-regulated TBC protein 1 isoform X3 [Anolis sagrei ordinatus]